MGLHAINRFDEQTRRCSTEELATPAVPPRVLAVHVDCKHPHRPRIDWLAVLVLASMLEALMRALSAVR